MVQVVTVVTRLIRKAFFRHHPAGKVVTGEQVVTGSNAIFGTRAEASRLQAGVGDARQQRSTDRRIMQKSATAPARREWQ